MEQKVGELLVNSSLRRINKMVLYVIVSKGLTKNQVLSLGTKKYAYGGAVFNSKEKALKVFNSLSYSKQRNQKILKIS